MENPLLFLIAIIIFLCFSFMFSGSETALLSVSRARIHRLKESGNKRAALVEKLQNDKERLINALLIGNNIVNTLSPIFATALFLHYFGESGLVYASIVMTPMVIIFGEVLPKTYAIHFSERFALFTAPFCKISIRAFAPLIRMFRKITRMIFKIFGIELNPNMHLYDIEELRGAIDLHKGDEPDIAHERAMLRSILDLSDVDVEDVMRHRKDVMMIDITKPKQEILDEILSCPFTRIPIYKEESEDIIGVLHVKDLLRAVHSSDAKKKERKLEDLDILSLASPPWFIPNTSTLLDQLQAFKRRREHFAIVVDEYGSFMGIVTLEDILEEIVGEISDEHDLSAKPGIRKLQDGSVLVEGTVTIRDLNREFEWKLPDEQASTIAGLVLYETRQIPKPGQVFEYYGFRFEIIRRQRNQITAIKIKRIIPQGTQ